MNSSEWSIRLALPKCIEQVFDHLPKYGNHTIRFEREKLESKDGYQSDILVGRMIYIDHKGQQIRSKPLLLKMFPESFQKSSFTELTFQNEIFAYSKMIPFFATLNRSVLSFFPEFYYAKMDLSDREEGIIVMENLIQRGYRAPTSKTFLDIEHLLLMVKKLGEFHAYSYQAKNQCPEKFFSLVNCLTETHFSVTKTMPHFLHELNEYIFDILSQNERYNEKVKQIRRLIGGVEEFMTKIFHTRNEPLAVLCHGDFLRNNLLCKYDEDGRNNLEDVKFIDLGNMRYCTPINDLGLILYMCCDQPTRDKYWDLLIETYHESLKNTFPDNDLVPIKEDILAEFKHNILQPYLLVAPCIPWLITVEEASNDDWYKEIFAPEYVEYQDLPIAMLPDYVRVKVFLKMFKPDKVKKSLDVLCDIIDRGFV